MKKLEYIARIHTDFPTKFGIPRQSGLVSTKGTIVFEPEYRKEEALKGLEEYSHLWLIWEFSESIRDTWSPTVRPPRLGGNRRGGVFATRSPFRPDLAGISGAVYSQPGRRSGRIRSDCPVSGCLGSRNVRKKVWLLKSKEQI